MLGQIIGNYRITKLLAEGGMGAVYLAEHPGIGRKVAVKVLLPDVARDAEMVRRFFNEARAAHSIRHPGIVEILDFGTLATGTSYLVMEFLDGESLAARLKRTGRLRMEVAVDITIQAAAALGAAHAQEIVHRDLKPDNLFLVPDTRAAGHEIVKVLDFGIAKLGLGPNGAGSFKTRTGVLMGTPVYMSPEQCLGTKEVDHRTDIYALAVILYQMLCGAPPFVSEGHGELIHMQISAPPPLLRTFNPDIPVALENTVLRALAKDPAHRFQSMAAFQQALASSPHAARSSGATVAWRSPGGDGDGQGRGTSPAADPEVRVPGTTLSASASVVDREIAKLRRSRWRAPVAIGVVAAAALVAVALTFKMGESASPAPPTAPASSVVASAARAPSAPAASPKVAPRPEATPISVSLTSEPSGARVVREKDQAVIGVTPFKESWPPATGTERLRIEMVGYGSESVLIPLDRGSELRFALKRAVKPARPATPRARHARPARSLKAEPVPL